jgi:hypothetical protein
MATPRCVHQRSVPFERRCCVLHVHVARAGRRKQLAKNFIEIIDVLRK